MYWWTNPSNQDREIRVVITENDVLDALGEMDSIDRYCLSEWSEDKASIEERLMALQLVARKLGA